MKLLFGLPVLFAFLFPPSLPAIALGDVESTWQFENSLNETNSGTALLPVGQLPAYSAVMIGGDPATALDLPALPSTHWIEMANNVGGNGGSALGRTNEWTLVLDLKLPSQATDAALFQTDASNANDAELHVMGGPGLEYEYYETGELSALPDFDALSPVATGTVADFDLSPRLRDDHFAFRFRGRIRIATPGSYTFYTTSDDGCQLRINDTLVIDNDGLHSVTTAFGSVTLDEGTHDIEVTYFENTGDSLLSVEYEGPGIARQAIPASLLTHGNAGAIRLGADQVSDPAALQLDKWHRLAITSAADGSDLALKVFVDGIQSSINGAPVTSTKPLDGDWSLPSVVKLFTDDNAETQPLLVNSIAFWGGALTEVQVTALGSPFAPGLPDLYVLNTNNDGPGSLRAAIPTVRDGGVLFFDTGLDGQSIVLGTGGPLEISGKALAIDADHLSPKPIINGADSFRIFSVLSDAALTIRGLDLTDGFSPSGGGGIRNLGELNVTRCTIRNCDASNGGGLINESSGSLSLIESTVANNTAGAGGGITNAGAATIERCTISGNLAGSAGGIEIINFTTLINCTVANNTANDGGGGGISTLGSLTFINCTVSGNDCFDPFGFSGGGGIFLDFGTVLTVENSVLTGNTSNVAGQNNIGGFGDVSSGGANLTSGDPLLEPLGDYGGPTQTMPPTEGSPAGGTGIPSPNTPATDQRGYPRVVGSLDLGAYESDISGESSPYDGWVAENIPAGEDGFFNGDPDGDGITNGAEYAFRLQPLVYDAILEPLASPTPSDDPDANLAIVIPYRDSATDLIYILLETSDLVTWNEIYRYTVQTATEIVGPADLQASIDAQNQTITVTDTLLNPDTTFWKIGVKIAP